METCRSFHWPDPPVAGCWPLASHNWPEPAVAGHWPLATDHWPAPAVSGHWPLARLVVARDRQSPCSLYTAAVHQYSSKLTVHWLSLVLTTVPQLQLKLQGCCVAACVRSRMLQYAGCTLTARLTYMVVDCTLPTTSQRLQDERLGDWCTVNVYSVQVYSARLAGEAAVL